MNILMLLLALVVWYSPASAADRVIRDRNGTIIGTWNDRPDGTGEFRDRNGTLRIDRSRQGGDTIYRNRNGTIIGVEPN